jgi:hypothetical protein
MPKNVLDIEISKPPLNLLIPPEFNTKGGIAPSFFNSWSEH